MHYILKALEEELAYVDSFGRRTDLTEEEVDALLNAIAFEQRVNSILRGTPGHRCMKYAVVGGVTYTAKKAVARIELLANSINISVGLRHVQRMNPGKQNHVFWHAGQMFIA
jgi:hypothetical protein